MLKRGICYVHPPFPKERPLASPYAYLNRIFPWNESFLYRGFSFIGLLLRILCGIDHVSYYTFPEKKGGDIWKDGKQDRKEASELHIPRSMVPIIATASANKWPLEI